MTSAPLTSPPFAVLRATVLVVLAVLAAASTAVAATVLMSHAGSLPPAVLGVLVALVLPASAAALTARRHRRAAVGAAYRAPAVTVEAARGIREIERWLAARSS